MLKTLGYILAIFGWIFAAACFGTAIKITFTSLSESYNGLGHHWTDNWWIAALITSLVGLVAATLSSILIGKLEQKDTEQSSESLTP